MSETKETYTREELAEMHRLGLRRICKARGMSSEDCSKMEFEDMVEWILKQQGGGGGGGGKGKAAPKAAPKEAPREEPEEKKAEEKPAPKGGGGRKVPPKLPPRGKPAPKEETASEGGSDVPLIGDKILDVVTKLDEKADTSGEVMDQNFKAIIDDLNELRADVYKVLELLKHLGAWMENDSILSAENAPDSLGFQEKEAELDEACSGNGESGE